MSQTAEALSRFHPLRGDGPITRRCGQLLELVERSPAAVGWPPRDKRRLVSGAARAARLLRGMAKVP